MQKLLKSISEWILGVFFIYLMFLVISIIPAIPLSPFILYEFIKNPSTWSDLHIYYQIVVTIGTIIFLGIIAIEINKLIQCLRRK